MEPDKKSNGALVGLVVIIIILIIGGFYMWQTNPKGSDQTSQTGAEAVTNQDAAALDSLGQDVTATDTSTGVDASIIN